MTLNELYEGLKQRDRGMAAFDRFMQDCRSGIESDRAHAAAYHLLLSITARFCDRYDREPLPLTTAQEAKDALLRLTDQARAAETRSADEQIRVLNAIATTELG
ncbi:MAG: hypothetical protein FJX67_02885 [Alphaproteobacteria bacterium]|nr:hypothetical protein [Alphaproteobacteria bacterium]